jgi:hypothetical protein
VRWVLVDEVGGVYNLVDGCMYVHVYRGELGTGPTRDSLTRSGLYL